MLLFGVAFVLAVLFLDARKCMVPTHVEEGPPHGTGFSFAS